MFEFAVKNGIILSVAILIICLLGLLAMFRVPVQMIPDLDARTLTVRTTWPGASPQDIEKEILIEQETYLRSLPNLERMTSTATTGEATIELDFPHGTVINEVLIRVNNALSQVPAYPENVDQPLIVTSSVSDSPFMFFRVQPQPGNPAAADLTMLFDFIDDHVRTRLERVAGVSRVDQWGGGGRQVRIYVDPMQLAERRISMTQLRDAIRARNRDISGGDVDSGKRRYLLRTMGRFETLDQLEAMVIARRGGSSIRLGDVARVELEHAELRVRSYANGRPTITLGVRRQVGANVIEVMADVMAQVADINANLLRPKGLQMELTSDDVQYVKDAITLVSKNLLIGALLATVVLFLFLRSVPATLVGAAGIPVCTIVAFLGLLLMQRTINVISLAGIAFAIGMTLDNSIVVLENIDRLRLAGLGRVQAALKGVREVWSAVLASTLTTVFVFIPLIFISEEAGQLYSDIAIAIAASILMSMLVAITVVPSACAFFLGDPAPPTSGRSRLQRWGRAGEARIVALLDWLLAGLGRRLGLVAGVLALTAAVILGLTPKAEYLPEGEESKTFAFMYAPPGYNLAEMATVLERMHDYLLPHLGEDPQAFARGETDVPALRFLVSYVRSQSLLMIAESRERDQIDALIAAISRQFGEVPGMISFASRGSIFASNLGGSRSINLDISGVELEPLFDTGLRVFRKAKTLFDSPQIRPQPPSLTLGQPMLEVRPDWERAAELGFSARDLGYTVWALADGAFVDEFFLDDDKIDMYLYSSAGVVQRPQDIQTLLLYSEAGGMVPLNAVATVRETVGTEIIRRVDGVRTITLSIIPPREVPLETAVETVNREIVDGMRTAGQLPQSVSLRISGASDRLQATRDAMAGNFLVAVLIAYLLMVAIFRHWGYPLLIMTTVPIGISGGIIGLWLTNTLGAQLHWLGMADIQQPFDVITMLGFLVLTGTVVNNPILLVEQALKNRREQGMAVLQAVRESTRMRLRPIIMSSITTVLGLSPLVFNPGAGTELYRGLGAVVLFGILFSTVITLTFMPILLSLVIQASDSLPGRRKGLR